MQACAAGYALTYIYYSETAGGHLNDHRTDGPQV
jgi:hypothetical protein